MSKEEKKVESYEEQVRKEFEQTQGLESEVVTDLGKVNLNLDTSLDDDPNVIRINKMIGYHDVPLEELPSKGRYLPNDARISIRAARVGEIREFSTIDEENKKDVIDKLTYILSQCVKVYYGNVPGSYKDITASDRIILVLKIRELTFIDGGSSIKIPVPENACKTVGCHPQETVDFNTSSITFVEPPAELEKYYDQTSRCYNVSTKNFGNISIYSPNIGVSTAVSDWVVKQLNSGKKIEQTLAEILQFMIKDWRGLSDRVIESKMTEMAGWDINKFTLVYRLAERISVGIEYNITTKCDNCGGEITVPITFPDGYKSLFIQTISDFGDELL